MSQLEIKIVKKKKDELELEFKEKLFKKSDGEGLKVLGEEDWQEGKKGVFYKEIPSKELAEVLKSRLVKRGMDAYAYEPHPLAPGYRLNISGKNPKKGLKKAIKDMKKEWNDFGKLLEKKLK